MSRPRPTKRTVKWNTTVSEEREEGRRCVSVKGAKKRDTHEREG